MEGLLARGTFRQRAARFTRRELHASAAQPHPGGGGAGSGDGDGGDGGGAGGNAGAGGGDGLGESGGGDAGGCGGGGAGGALGGRGGIRLSTFVLGANLTLFNTSVLSVSQSSSKMPRHRRMRP